MCRYFIPILMLVSSVFSQDQLPAQPIGQFYADSRVLFREIMNTGSGFVKVAEAFDMEVVKVGIDLIGTMSPKQEIKNFSTDFSYIISAAGSPTRVADLDIKVYYSTAGGSPILMAQDTAINPTATVSFDPPVAGNYIIEIRAASMKPTFEQTMGYYFLMVAHSYPKQLRQVK